MSQVPSTGNSNGSNTEIQTKYGKSLQDVNVDQFMQLMIAELTNQDPMNPMDNAQMMEQISQMREISSTDRLIGTLDSVLLGQNMATASSMIGQEIKALDDDAKEVSGVVDRVSVVTSGDKNQNRSIKIHVGEHSIELKNIREVVAD